MPLPSSSSCSSSNFLTSSSRPSSSFPPLVSVSGHPTLCTYTPFWHPRFSSSAFLGVSSAANVLCKSSGPRSSSLVSSFLLEVYRQEERHAIGSSASSVYTPRDRSCSELGRQAEKYGGEKRGVKSLLEREIVNGVDVLYLPDLFEGEQVSLLDSGREREKKTRRERRRTAAPDADETKHEDAHFFCTCSRREEEDEDEEDRNQDEEEEDGGGEEETGGESEEEERRRGRRGLPRERSSEVDEEMRYASQGESFLYRRREAKRRRERERDRRDFLRSPPYERRQIPTLQKEEEEEDDCFSLSSSSSSSSCSDDESFFSSTLLRDGERKEHLDETSRRPSLLLPSSSSPADSSRTSPHHPNSSFCQQQRRELDSFSFSSSASFSRSSSSSPRPPSRRRQERGCEVYVQRLPLNESRRVSVPVLVSPVGPQHDALQFLALRYHVNPEEEKEEREERSRDEALPSPERRKNLSHLSIHSGCSPFSTVECRVQPQRILEFRARAFWSSDEEEEEKERFNSCCSFPSSSCIRGSPDRENEEEEERNEERSFGWETGRRRRSTTDEWTDASKERDEITDSSSNLHRQQPPLSSSTSSSSSFLPFHRSPTRNCRHLRFSSSSSSFLSDGASQSHPPSATSSVQLDNNKKKKKAFRQARNYRQIKTREEKKSFPGTLRLLEVKVDDQHFEKKWIFTRNRRGFSIGLLRLSEEVEEEEEEIQDTPGGIKRRKELACSSSSSSSSSVVQRLLYEHLVDGRYSRSPGLKRGAKTKKIVKTTIAREEKKRILLQQRYLSPEEGSSSFSVSSPQENLSLYCPRCGRPLSPSSPSFSSSFSPCRSSFTWEKQRRKKKKIWLLEVALE